MLCVLCWKETSDTAVPLHQNNLRHDRILRSCYKLCCEQCWDEWKVLKHKAQQPLDCPCCKEIIMPFYDPVEEWFRLNARKCRGCGIWCQRENETNCFRKLKCTVCGSEWYWDEEIHTILMGIVLVVMVSLIALTSLAVPWKINIFLWGSGLILLLIRDLGWFSIFSASPPSKTLPTSRK